MPLYMYIQMWVGIWICVCVNDIYQDVNSSYLWVV